MMSTILTVSPLLIFNQMKKLSLLLLAGTLALGVVQPAMAHGHHHHPGVHIPHQPGPVDTLINLGLIGAGAWWEYGSEIEYEHDGETYVLCNDHGRRYYC